MDPITLLLLISVIAAFCYMKSSREKETDEFGDYKKKVYKNAMKDNNNNSINCEKAQLKPLPGPSGWRCLKAFISGARKNNLHLLAWDWAEQYGDLFAVNLLNQQVVYINDGQLARRIFNDPELKELTNDRPPTFIAKYAIFNNKNVAFTSRTLPQQRRRKIFHGMLKFYGDNVSRFENIITKSLSWLTDRINQDQSVDLCTEFSRATLRIVDELLVGEHTGQSEINMMTLGEFDNTFNKMFIFDIETVLRPFPFLRLVPGLSYKATYERLIAAREKLLKIYFYDRKKTHVKGQKIGMVDHLISTQMELEEKGDSSTLDDEVIKAILCETIIASYLTTSRTMNTLFLLLIKHPDIQERVYQEILDVIGDDTPRMTHRVSMPFTEATIIEVLRYASGSAFLLPHYAREDIEVNGYLIKKGSMIAANAWYCQRRPDKWDDPWTFNPYRFLDAKGQLYPADHPTRKNLLIFGTGPRGCPGEAFARSRLFLAVTTILQHAEFYVKDDQVLPSIDPRDWKPAALIEPDEFKCWARVRKGAKNIS